MSFEEVLATWLPGQRWFAGKDTPIADLAIVADTRLAGPDPGLRHLIVAVVRGGASGGGGSGNGLPDRYQVLVGLRATIPDRLAHAIIGPADDGMTAYDAL